jgi:mono/diheme cytochrome c family protein
MQEQPRVDPFDEGMSAPPPFTVAQGGLAHPPPLVTRALVEHGRRSFETLCAACHGMRGNGHSVVATKMLLRPPPSLLDARIRALSDEQIEGVIAHGYGLMPSYSFALSEDDRYATVAYVRALEVAQGVNVAALPSALAAKLVREAP